MTVYISLYKGKIIAVSGDITENLEKVTAHFSQEPVLITTERDDIIVEKITFLKDGDFKTVDVYCYEY